MYFITHLNYLGEVDDWDLGQGDNDWRDLN